MTKHSALHVLEICAGAGGQALGLEQGGFEHAAAVEIDIDACATLRLNRRHWTVMGPGEDGNVRKFDARGFKGVDLLAGGVPCPPFSVAGKQLGPDDERDLFPSALRIAREAKPRAVLLENVPGLATSRFKDYRAEIEQELRALKYSYIDWQPINACNFGVPQLRPRFVLVAFSKKSDWLRFHWPVFSRKPKTVGEALFNLMASNGWPGAFRWKEEANAIAPTIVGGSKKHGGADLGPTRAKAAWKRLGVDGMGIANSPPDASFPTDCMPRLTLEMVARIQGFPASWKFSGKKTAKYRQIGNAFPPPVARALGTAISNAILGVAEPRDSDERSAADSTVVANQLPLFRAL